MGRPTSMTGPGVDFMGSPATVNIVNGVQYGPASELLQMSCFGATETRQYHTRLQMTHLTVPGQLNISYNFASQNNGQIASQTDNLSGEQITYQYDALKRLYSASASAWNQTFTYDGFGNLTDKVGTGSAPANHSPVKRATNQLTGYTYDANGNLITTGFGWDAENRMSYANAGGTQYAYDSKNKRVWTGNYTCPGGFCGPGYGWQFQSETIFFYGNNGKRLASYTPQVQNSYGTPQSIYYLIGEERVYFKRKYIGNANTNTMSAALGQDRAGSVGKYFPYGEERNNPQLPNDTVKFATFTRDSVTGLDYADQRYYSGDSARFLSPDPYKTSSGSADPVSWNRYTYTRGDPVNRIDPTGQDDCYPIPVWDPQYGWIFIGCSVYGYSYPDLTASITDQLANYLGDRGRIIAGNLEQWGMKASRDLVKNKLRDTPGCADFITSFPPVRSWSAQELSDLLDNSTLRFEDLGSVVGQEIFNPSIPGLPPVDSGKAVFMFRAAYTYGNTIVLNSNIFPFPDLKNIQVQRGPIVSFIDVLNSQSSGITFTSVTAGALTILHELSHMAGRPDDTDLRKFNQEVIDHCLK